MNENSPKSYLSQIQLSFMYLHTAFTSHLQTCSMPISVQFSKSFPVKTWKWNIYKLPQTSYIHDEYFIKNLEINHICQFRLRGDFTTLNSSWLFLQICETASLCGLKPRSILIYKECVIFNMVPICYMKQPAVCFISYSYCVVFPLCLILSAMYNISNIQTLDCSGWK